METVNPIFFAIILYILAIGLAVVDVYVPSAGMLVVLSSIAALGSILFGFRAGTTTGMTMLTLVAASIPLLAVLTLRIWPHTPVARRIVLPPPGEPRKSDVDQQDDLQHWIGCVVESEYPLMPAGQLTIGRKPFNAMAEAGYVDAGQRVEVVAVRQRNLVVRPTDKPLTPITKPERFDSAALRAIPAAPPQSLLDLPAEELGIESIED